MPGASACIAKITLIARRVEENVKKAIDEICNLIFRISTENWCPIDTGELKASARDEIYNLGKIYYHVISYATSYAWFVHELIRFHRHGDRKYLEVPVLMYKSKLLIAVRDAFRSAL